MYPEAAQPVAETRKFRLRAVSKPGRRGESKQLPPRATSTTLPKTSHACGAGSAGPARSLVRRLVPGQDVRGDATPVGDLDALLTSPCTDAGQVVPR